MAHTRVRTFAAVALACAAGLAASAHAADFDGDGNQDWVVGSPLEDNGAIVNAGCVTIVYANSTSEQLFYQSETSDMLGWAVAVGDFNGDGKDDLAIGAPGENSSSGEVVVCFGHANGLNVLTREYINQDATSVLGSRNGGEMFGRCLAAGDFDGDGYDDLAVGVPYETVGTAAKAGLVQVFFGTAEGFIDNDTLAVDDVQISQSGTVAGTAEANDYFGFAMAVGDFRHDANAIYDDLAIGVPGEDYGATDDGAVNVLYGGISGLRTDNDIYFSQSAFGGTAEDGDGYGYALVAGEFGVSSYDDLAIGGPTEDIGNVYDAGAVGVVFGSANGLDTSFSGNEILHQDLEDVEGECETLDRFGEVLAVGDLNGGICDELIVGMRYEDIDGDTNCGMIEAFFPATSEGFIDDDTDDVDAQTAYQSKGAYDGTGENYDYFGASVAVFDWNGDGYEDVLVGVPGEEDTISNAGYVQLIFCDSGGLTEIDLLLSEGESWTAGNPESQDQYGSCVGR